MPSDLTLLRRYAECSGFVLLWMASEHYFHLSPIAGQLMGIPLTAAFQLVVARRPLQQLWAFDAEKIRLDGKALALAGGLVAGCAALLWLGRGHSAAGLNQRLMFFWLIVAAAIPAAVALREQRAAAFRRALPWLLPAVVLRVAWQAAWHNGEVLFPPAKLLDFATTWVCEFVGLFLVDEVVFRGALDPHLRRASSGRLHEWCSAVFVSILWSIWHLPAYNPHAKGFLALFSGLAPFYIGVLMMGVLLSFCARKARTLVPTSIMHAFGNAYVLALMK
jgi:membrane protease YdiL (CAAX protease family)